MNFLAHAWLGRGSDDDRVGGVIGDFVKGILPAGLPQGLAEGVRLHRLIDSFADRHPAFQASRARVSPRRRRVAGIMVDLFYDHFLAVHWLRHSEESLEQFVATTYALLERCKDLPPRFAEVFPHMRGENWLLAYRSPERVGQALDRMATRRLTRPNQLAGAGEELLRHYAGFAADFQEFLPAAEAYVAGLRAARGSAGGREQVEIVLGVAFEALRKP